MEGAWAKLANIFKVRIVIHKILIIMIAKVFKVLIMIDKAFIIIKIERKMRRDKTTRLIIIALRHANLQVSWIGMKDEDGLED